jgi:hypothetical protein
MQSQTSSLWIVNNPEGTLQALYFPTNFSNAASCFAMKSLVG